MEIKVNKLNYNLFAGSTTCLFIMVISHIYIYINIRLLSTADPPVGLFIC